MIDVTQQEQPQRPVQIDPETCAHCGGPLLFRGILDLRDNHMERFTRCEACDRIEWTTDTPAGIPSR